MMQSYCKMLLKTFKKKIRDEQIRDKQNRDEQGLPVHTTRDISILESLGIAVIESIFTLFF